jgi:hypothetical protein
MTECAFAAAAAMISFEIVQQTVVFAYSKSGSAQRAH